LVAREFRPAAEADAVGALLADSFEPTGVMLDWKQVVTSAQRGWYDEANCTRSGGWYDEATMVYLLFAIRMAQHDVRYKAVVLRLLSRVRLKKHEGDIEEGNSHPSTLRTIQSCAQSLSDLLKPELLRFREDNQLDRVLGRGVQLGDADKSWVRHDEELTQQQFLAFLDPAYEDAIKAVPANWDGYNANCQFMLVIVCHYLQPLFAAATATIGQGDAGSGDRDKSVSHHRPAPPKTWRRMLNKAKAEYKGRTYPPAIHNKDPIR
jgi:hypothetical protein